MKAIDHETQQTSEESTFKALVQAYLIAQKEGCDLARGEQILSRLNMHVEWAIIRVYASKEAHHSKVQVTFVIF